MITWVEIDSKAIVYNLKQYRKLIGKNVMLMPVIKANAYGHGFLEIAKIVFNSFYVNRVCTVSLDEAVILIKNNFTQKPIQIISFFEKDDVKIKLAIKHGVIFPIYSLDYAKYLNKIAQKLNTKAKVEIKLDTGAGRVGIAPKDALIFFKKISNLKNIEIEGIYSHFASSEENNKQTASQNKLFTDTIKKLENNGITIKNKHMACSVAVLSCKNSHYNAMRLGIGMYGLYGAKTIEKQINLKPALSFKTTIIQVKTLPRGSKIGYGGTYTTKTESKIATLPVGYYDGYDRKFSNCGFVEIKGQKCPVRGRICMNLTMVDVSKIKNVKAGNTAVLIGKKITADNLANWANTINYEIIDRINPLLPRIVK